jgi:DeoR family transcriptional regulator, fructose operon transcriptional repressor
VQTFFASAAALGPAAGALEMTLEEAEMKRSIAAGAGEVVLAVDPTRLAGRALAVGLEWDQLDILVTELDPSDPRLDPFRELAQLL